MKINDIQSNQNIPARSKGAEQAPADSSFAAILQSHLHGSESVDPKATVSPLSKNTAATPAQLRIEGLAVSETTIETLDSFQAAMANVAFKTADLEPFVDALENDLVALKALRKELSADEPLGRLLEQIAAVSYLETAKYRRGDYS